MSCRFEQFLGPFTMLLFERYWVLWHLSNHVFRSPSLQTYIRYEGHFFFKMFKIWSTFQKRRKKLTKTFCFLNNFIWIGCLKSLLLRRILVIPSHCVKAVLIFYTSLRETFSYPLSLAKISGHADLRSLSDRLPCCISQCLLKRDLLDIYLTTSFVVSIL